MPRKPPPPPRAGAPSDAGRLVGFIAPEVQSGFYATITAVLAGAFAASGLQLVVAVSDDDPDIEHRHVMAMRQARAAGIVITPTSDLLEPTARLLDGLPVVQLVRSNPRIDRGWVGIDDRLGVGLATRHLLELGHRRIGFIGGFEALTTGHERKNGYCDALAAFGAPYDETLVALGPPRPSFGLQAALDLIDLHPPITALVLGSSQLTLGALTAFQQRGLTAPDHLSVVGYSDPEWFRIWGRGLTTIALPIEDIAVTAAQSLLRAMERGQPAGDGRGGVRFQPQLVERGSVRPMPGYPVEP